MREGLGLVSSSWAQEHPRPPGLQSNHFLQRPGHSAPSTGAPPGWEGADGEPAPGSGADGLPPPPIRQGPAAAGERAVHLRSQRIFLISFKI